MLCTVQPATYISIYAFVLCVYGLCVGRSVRRLLFVGATQKLLAPLLVLTARYMNILVVRRTAPSLPIFHSTSLPSQCGSSCVLYINIIYLFRLIYFKLKDISFTLDTCCEEESFRRSRRGCAFWSFGSKTFSILEP